MSSMVERVSRGAALLDDRDPGWALRINQEQLRIRDCRQCVLGQLYGNYTNALMAWRWSDEKAAKHGFTLTAGELDNAAGFGAPTESRHPWRDLRAIWLFEISQRMFVPQAASIGEEEKEWEAPAPVDVPQEVDSPDEARETEQRPVEEPVPA